MCETFNRSGIRSRNFVLCIGKRDSEKLTRLGCVKYPGLDIKDANAPPLFPVFNDFFMAM